MFSRHPLLALFVVVSTVAALSACEGSPCPRGELPATLFIQSEHITASGLAYYGPQDLGTLEDPHPDLVTCKYINKLNIMGNISTLAPFDGVEELGQLDIESGVREAEVVGLPNMRVLGGLQMRGGIENLDIFRSLEVAGRLDFVGSRATLVAPNLIYASRIAGGSIHTLSAPRLEEVEFGIKLTFGDVPSLEGLPALRYVGDDLELLGLDIEEVHLDALEEVDGSVRINGHSRLASWNGLGALTSVSGNVTVGDNPMLMSADVLRSLDGVDVGGFVRVCQNYSTEEAPDECPDFPAQR